MALMAEAPERSTAKASLERFVTFGDIFTMTGSSTASTVAAARPYMRSGSEERTSSPSPWGAATPNSMASAPYFSTTRAI